MQKEAQIVTDDILKHAMDFEHLRSEGLKLIEKYGSYFWTDYNHHDPGITILDVLVYAITELSYRTSFSIEDLLTNINGSIDNATFFPAHEILSNAPISILDWRKKIIDIKGIANAWWLPYSTIKDKDGYYIPNKQEVPLYFDIDSDKISYNPTDINNKQLQPLILRGLNKVVIELDEDPILGDLNDMHIMMHVWHKEKFIEVKISTNIVSWHHEKAKLLSLLNKPNKVTIASNEIINNNVVVNVRRYTQQEQGIVLKFQPIDSNEINECQSYFSTEKNICSAIDLLAQKCALIQSTLKSVAETINANRNITEDVLSIEVIKKSEIAICADIEIDATVDAAQVLAEIWLAITNVINPPIKFYRLQELLNEGKNSKEIFTGPLLNNGFLKDNELIKSSLPNAIYGSDIIAKIMDINGVIAVNNLVMTAYDNNGIPIQNAINQKWILPLNGTSKAVFNKAISKLLLFKGNIPFLLSDVQTQIAQQLYETKLVSTANNKQYVPTNRYQEPKGTFLPLNKFYSLQTDLPRNYRIGNNLPSENEDPATIAAAKQLKAYLFFYESIIANFFSQLHHAKDLLNIGKGVQTYANHKIDEEALGIKNNYYQDILKESLANIYCDQSILEEDEVRLERKNRALDHLLARFSETFNEYALTMYQISLGKTGMPINQENIINSKEAFLRDYVAISQSRAVGINYSEYNSNNDFKMETLRGGFEKRIARLLGIQQIDLDKIVTEPNVQEQWTINLNNDQDYYVFHIMNPEESLDEKWHWCMEHFYDDDNYIISKVGKKYIIYLYNNIKVAKLDMRFDTFKDAHAYLIKMIQNINAYFENFYCIEHILLRPYFKNIQQNFKLLSTCLNDNCGSIENSDPYSAKATIVFPGYLQRFKNLTFRKFAEQTIRKETPAHVLLKICWVGYKDMIKLQKAYREWIPCLNTYNENKALFKTTKAQFKNLVAAQNNLISALEEMNNIYPNGTLYDCKISNMDNPIILGNTALGSTKNN